MHCRWRRRAGQQHHALFQWSIQQQRRQQHYTLNFFLWCREGWSPRGTGVLLLNNELDDFHRRTRHIGALQLLVEFMGPNLPGSKRLCPRCRRPSRYLGDGDGAVGGDSEAAAYRRRCLAYRNRKTDVIDYRMDPSAAADARTYHQWTRTWL
jgi:hypothetical protein